MVMLWLTLLLIVALVVVVALAWKRAGRAQTSAEAVAVAHVRNAQEHPRFKRRLKIFQAVVATSTVGLLIAGLVGAYLSGRPMREMTMPSELATRDIVLCLDVSGSVIEFDQQVLQSFEELIDDFQGERVGLVIWNAGPRTIFPLTDDYDMMRHQLDYAQEALAVETFLGKPYPKNEEEYMRFVAGTEAGASYGSSLIGDGLASCTFAFDLAEQDRSRTIIFATDNDIYGRPVYELEEAAALAQSKGITVHGLYIATGQPKYGEAMKEAVEGHGGHFYHADDPAAAEQIVEQVQSQDAADLGDVGELVSADRPGWWPAILGGLLVIFLVLAWRFRL